MKKIYIVPELMVVELGIRRNVMLSASDGSGNTTLTDGGDGTGDDIGVKENFSIWDNEW